MFILYFLLLLGPLVFFHELGHYLVARWMGVRVLSFSIGFGPVVASWHRNGTEYAVRAFPLGGFVKMLGDDPTGSEEMLTTGRNEHPEIRALTAEFDSRMPADSFAAKPVWRRAFIVAAGPIANFLLPIVIIFGGSMAVDSTVVSGRIGTVLPGGPAAKAGLRSGDRIVAVDGTPIDSFMDLRREISARPGKKAVVAYERNGKRDTLTLVPASKRDVRLPELGIVDTVGRIQVLPDGQSAILSVQPGSSAWKDGLRSGFRVVKVAATKTPRYYEFEAALAAAKGQTVTLEVKQLVAGEPMPRKELRNARKALYGKETRKVVVNLPAARDAGSITTQLGIGPAQAVVGVVEKDSPADKQANLRSGDEILAVDGKDVGSFFVLLDRLTKPYDDVRADPANRGLEPEVLLTVLKKALAKPRKVQIRRGDKVRTVDFQLGVKLDKNERPQLTFGASQLQRYEAPEKVPNNHRLAYAAERTVSEMGEAMKVTLLTVAGLFRGHVPMKEVGGPIFMAQLAARTADLGWSYFLKLMVWISINLAILNLLPIPLVDGGHLLFLAVEAIKRKPVSLRTRMIASYIGMSFIGLLFVVVMKNDVERLITALVN